MEREMATHFSILAREIPWSCKKSNRTEHECPIFTGVGFIIS